MFVVVVTFFFLKKFLGTNVSSQARIHIYLHLNLTQVCVETLRG